MTPHLVETVDTYEQDPDCCGPHNNLANYLKIKTADGGGGHYLVIETGRWAIDDEDIPWLIGVLKKTLKRVRNEKKKEDDE